MAQSSKGISCTVRGGGAGHKSGLWTHCPALSPAPLSYPVGPSQPRGQHIQGRPLLPHPSPRLDRGWPAWHDPIAGLQASGGWPHFLRDGPFTPTPTDRHGLSPPSVPWNQGGRGSPRSPASYRGGNIEAQGTENRSSSRGWPCPCPPPPALALSSQALSQGWHEVMAGSVWLKQGLVGAALPHLWPCGIRPCAAAQPEHLLHLHKLSPRLSCLPQRGAHSGRGRDMPKVPPLTTRGPGSQATSDWPHGRPLSKSSISIWGASLGDLSPRNDPQLLLGARRRGTSDRWVGRPEGRGPAARLAPL